MAHYREQHIIGFFPGVWDLLHAGHMDALKEARAQCDFLVVGLQVDPTIDRPDKNKPIMTEKERVTMLKGIKYVDMVWIYKTEKQLYDLDSSDMFDMRFMGEDHKGRKHHKILAPIVYVSRQHNLSSSELRKRVYLIECSTKIKH